MTKIASFLLTAALVAGPASASAPAPAPAPDPNKRICVKEPKIGTRLKRTRCQTVAQWAEMRREGRDLTQWLQQIADIAGGR